MIIGIGIPISQSSTPLPKPIVASNSLLCPDNVHHGRPFQQIKHSNHSFVIWNRNGVTGAVTDGMIAADFLGDPTGTGLDMPSRVAD